MRPIEEYEKHADKPAQDVVNAWGLNMQAGNGPLLTDEFLDLFEEVCRFRMSKCVADNRRAFGMLSELDAAEEEARRRAFACAYKSYWENKNRAA